VARLTADPLLDDSDPRELLTLSGYADPEPIWREFLETVVGPCAGLIELRFIREPTTHRVECRSIDEAVAAIGSRLDWNVYFGVATRRLPKIEFDRLEAQREPDPRKRRGAGGKANLAQLGAVWVDWDPAKSYIDSDDAIGHREEFLISLESIAPCHPHLITWSGAGFHCYWLFQEPEDVSTPDAVRRVEGILRGLARYAKTDPATTDASRILRIPATLNWPNAAKRRLGRTVSVSAIYQLDNGGRL
jgi:hypothetical protein